MGKIFVIKVLALINCRGYNNPYNEFYKEKKEEWAHLSF